MAYVVKKAGAFMQWCRDKISRKPRHAPEPAPSRREIDELNSRTQELDRQREELDQSSSHQAQRMRLQLESRELELQQLRDSCQARLDDAYNYPKPQFFIDHGYEHTINLAVTGNSGAGKSTLINMLRSMRASDPGAAGVGVSETTMEATPYPCPESPDVRLWDLPGAGTPNFPRDTYLAKMGLRYFDLVIVVAAGRFTEIDLMLLNELESFNIPSFAVRSKLDIDVRNNMRDKGAPPQQTVDEIWHDLQRNGISKPYLVSCEPDMALSFSELVSDIGEEIKKRGVEFVPPSAHPIHAPGRLPAYDSCNTTAPSSRRSSHESSGSGQRGRLRFEQGLFSGWNCYSSARQREGSCASMASNISIPMEGEAYAPHVAGYEEHSALGYDQSNLIGGLEYQDTGDLSPHSGYTGAPAYLDRGYQYGSPRGTDLGPNSPQYGSPRGTDLGPNSPQYGSPRGTDLGPNSPFHGTGSLGNSPRYEYAEHGSIGFGNLDSNVYNGYNMHRAPYFTDNGPSSPYYAQTGRSSLCYAENGPDPLYYVHTGINAAFG